MSTTLRVRIENRVITSTVINTITQLDETLRNFLSTINQNPNNSKHVIGLDIEKHFTSDGSNQVAEKVAIVKLCFGTSCLIIQLLHIKEPPCSLSEFFQLQELSFVGVGIKRCVEALNRDYGINCRNVVDLGELAADVKEMPSYRWFGLLDLCSKVCVSFDLNDNSWCNKSAETLGSWGGEILSKRQIVSATWGAFLCFCVGNQLFGGSLPDPEDSARDLK
ncbi:hypothetical protein SOVF_052780 [Spinacia oleracea]|uniref:3'-5' exonuclease n=1 Tax=Spinacia oleracea TaxID=3562 RepID=A0A9R0HSH9_SPIOL|nr:3'-5' exonuclease-like [Spinacia oleracea]KNA20348.1 hypothetical protein SOVF_052780 [Spinacia oleracea]